MSELLRGHCTHAAHVSESKPDIKVKHVSHFLASPGKKSLQRAAIGRPKGKRGGGGCVFMRSVDIHDRYLDPEGSAGTGMGTI